MFKTVKLNKRFNVENIYIYIFWFLNTPQSLQLATYSKFKTFKGLKFGEQNGEKTKKIDSRVLNLNQIFFFF